MKTAALVLSILALHAVNALYESNEYIQLLTSSDFDDFVKHPGISVVKFYASWCGHCEAFAPKFKIAAELLQGVVRFGAVDSEAQKSIGSRFRIEGFPTVLVFKDGKVVDPIKYTGSREVAGLVEYLMDAVKELVTKRGKTHGAKLNFDKASSGGSGTCSGGPKPDSGYGGKKTSQDDSGHGSGGAEIILTEENFKRLVLDSEDDWLVSFYAPWCPHCKNLAPHWKTAAERLKGKFKIGSVDATVHQSLAQRYGIQGFPTIKYFPAGSKIGSPQDYQGGRTADDIVLWASDKAAKNKPPPEVYEITNSKVLHDSCDGKQLCIIGFLPNILDCASECRRGHINTMKKAAEKNKEKDWGWMWSPARTHKELESVLQVGGFGYPTMVAINLRKEKCAVLRGSFSAEGIREFLHDLMTGRGSVSLNSFTALPDIKSTEPWDGKDAKIEEEDEIDLSELGIKSEL